MPEAQIAEFASFAEVVMNTAKKIKTISDATDNLIVIQ